MVVDSSSHPHTHTHCLAASLVSLSVCPSRPSPCTTGLNRRISPFLTASNSDHPPIRRPVDVPSLPNHKPSIVLSNPIQSEPHAGTHSPTSHTPSHKTQTDSPTHSLTRPAAHSLTHCIINQWSRNFLHAPPPPSLSLACLTPLVSASAAHQPGSDLPAYNVHHRMRTAADHGNCH